MFVYVDYNDSAAIANMCADFIGNDMQNKEIYLR